MALSRNNTPNVQQNALNDEFSALQAILRSYLASNVGTVLAVEVVAVKGAYVDVKSVTQRQTTSGETIENMVIYNIPVMSIVGADIEISLNVAVGNKGLLIANKWDISNYKRTHTTAKIGSGRTFDYSDGFFLPLDFGNVFDGINLKKGNTSLQITENSVNITTETANITATQIDINASAVNIGGDGGQGVARIGDSVDLTTGLITTGSTVVKAL